MGADAEVLAVGRCRALYGRKPGAAPHQTPSSSSSTTDPLQDTAEPLHHVWGALVKTYLRKDRKHQKRREQQREWENNKVRGRREGEWREGAPHGSKYTAKGIAPWEGPAPQQRKRRTRSSRKSATPWLQPPAPPFALLKGLSVTHGCNKGGGEVSGAKLSLGKEEGWFSPSVLMFAFFCFPVIKYLC